MNKKDEQFQFRNNHCSMLPSIHKLYTFLSEQIESPFVRWDEHKIYKKSVFEKHKEPCIGNMCVCLGFDVMIRR